MPRIHDGSQQPAQGVLLPNVHTTRASSGVTPIAPDTELETPTLPRDLPQWAKDATSISARAREYLARLKPVVVRILTFWDHRVRTTIVGGRKLTIDPSGSYRAE